MQRVCVCVCVCVCDQYLAEDTAVSEGTTIYREI